MRTELRHNKDYLFLVDKDSLAEIGDYITDSYNIWKWEDNSSLLGRKKVIAYRKLNEQAPDLDLPVLPDPFEVNVPDSEYEEGMFGYTEIEVRIAQNAFKEGYKAAQSKTSFTLEDVKKAIEITKSSMGVDNCGESCYSNKTTDEIIQSLSTQKLPKEFILGEGGTIEEQIKSGGFKWKFN